MRSAFPPDVPPNWLVYFGVEDMASATGKVQEMGGGVLVPERQMPGGRFAVVQDPHGAVFALWEGSYDAPPGDAA
jgi:hypothetical protein